MERSVLFQSVPNNSRYLALEKLLDFRRRIGILSMHEETLVWTEHARFRMHLRQIPRATVERVFAHPTFGRRTP